jgi:hypothetical protein
MRAPSYSHGRQIPPPESKLTKDTGLSSYKKLNSYLAMSNDAWAPALGWAGKGDIRYKSERHLFHPNGYHHIVKWMPVLEPGYKRLSYIDFCNWYGLPDEELDV